VLLLSPPEIPGKINKSINEWITSINYSIDRSNTAKQKGGKIETKKKKPKKEKKTCGGRTVDKREKRRLVRF
jgi:hypothetical protein